MKCGNTLLTAVGITALLTGGAQANLITNGNFSTGDFTGWALNDLATFGNTGNGGTSPYPQVSSYDFGSGSQNAAVFQVGLTSGLFNVPHQGGITLSQVFNTAGGLLSFSANIAGLGTGNVDDGQFQILISGTPIAFFAFGTTSGNQLLTGNYAANAGTYDLEIEIYRNWYNSSNTPLQYISNINLAGTAIPEPITISIFGVGFAGAIAMRRRKKQA